MKKSQLKQITYESKTQDRKYMHNMKKTSSNSKTAVISFLNEIVNLKCYYVNYIAKETEDKLLMRAL